MIIIYWEKSDEQERLTNYLLNIEQLLLGNIGKDLLLSSTELF